MLGATRKIDQAKCTHAETVTITSAGMDRVICETCGHVSISHGTGLTSEIDRDMFARDTERQQETETTGTY